MPDALHEAVSSLGPGSRTAAIDNWVFIGEDGRDAYRRYLERAWTAGGLRKRCELAAAQLLSPAAGGGIDAGGGVGFVGGF